MQPQSLQGNITSNHYIVGVDGMNTPSGGVNMVLTGDIDGTIYYPSGGDIAIQLQCNINRKTI